jgi:hypothetical protein
MTRIIKTRLVDLEADHSMACPVRLPRQGWEEQFQEMAAQGDDQLLDAMALPSTHCETAEWQW